MVENKDMNSHRKAKHDHSSVTQATIIPGFLKGI
jgi:hypothetical protein